jgi:hypothetical protein
MRQRDRFRVSQTMVWVTLAAAFFFQAWAMVAFGVAAVPILAASIPSMLALVAAWSGITNWAEVRAPTLPAYDEDERMKGE